MIKKPDLNLNSEAVLQIMYKLVSAPGSCDAVGLIGYIISDKLTPQVAHLLLSKQNQR